MRGYSVGLIALLLSGCGSKIAPKGPVLTGWERTSEFADDQKSQARYTGEPRIASPVLPIMAFGLSYDVDLVLQSKHPNWDMHEYARVATPEGPLWIATEARAGTLDQYMVADVPDIDLLMPEIPVERRSAPMEVVDNSNDEALDYVIRYENFDGQPVEVTFKGDPPTRHQKKRNGNTMGHSRNQLLAALDVAHYESAFKAKLVIDEQNQRIKKISMFVPFQYALEQSQGGMATATFATLQGRNVPWEGTWQPNVLLAPMDEAAEGAEMEPEDETIPDEGMEEGPDTERPGDGDSGVERPEDAEEGEVEDESSDETQLSGEGEPEGDGLPEAEGDDAEMEGDDMEGDDMEGGDELADLEDLPDLDEMPDEIAIESAVMSGPPLADFTTVHAMPSGNQVEQQWRVERVGSRVVATQESGLRTLRYEYLVNGSAIELSSVAVMQYGRPVPTTHIQISPALPDLRRPFNGRVTSRYVIDINGQRNHAVGQLEAWWTPEGGVRLKLTPDAPDWTIDRAMLTSVNFSEGRADVKIERIGGS